MSSSGTPSEFRAACQQAARDLRALPKDLKRSIGREVKTEVSEPLAGKIRGAATGPWVRALTTGTKAAMAQGQPAVRVGGTARVLSHGGTPRDVVFGTEFGGSNKRSVQRSRRGRVFTRATTRQFLRNHRPFVFDTVDSNTPWVVSKFADIVGRIISRGGF